MGGGVGVIGMLFWVIGLGRICGERENNYRII